MIRTTVIIGLLLGATAARADACAPAGEPARVAAVLDDLDLALDDGRELRLAGIDPARATPDRPALGEDTRQRLSTWLSGREISVAPLAVADRWDRIPALVWADASPGQGQAGTPVRVAVAEIVLESGWGRARAEPGLPPCFTAFRAWERQARASGLGLWVDPYYAILNAEDGGALSQRTGAMALVEGRLSLGLGRARTYLRLGKGSGAFVATLSRRAAKTLAKAGLDTARLAGKRIRIRGFLDDRFGPRIEVTSADQIEVLDETEPGAGPQPAGPEQMNGP